MIHFYHTIPGCFTFPGLYKYIVDDIGCSPWHGVEVGVLAGQSAACLGAELITAGYTGLAKLDLVDLNADQVTIMQNLAPVHDVIGVFHNGGSVPASKLYEDGSLDFVFLDGDHAYPSIRADIDAWRPKVRRGGILSGHDYTPLMPDVVRAVDETFERFEIWPGTRFGKEQYFWPSWVVRV